MAIPGSAPGRDANRISEGMAQGQHPCAFTGVFRKKVSIGYLLYLPEAYGSKSAKWPLLLFLHGSGERGTDLNLVKRHGPPKLVEEGKQFDFILVSPQCPEGESWSPDALVALLDDIQAHTAVDPARVYVTGLSRGGRGTWDLALAYPDRFAAIVPICGKSNPDLAGRLRNVPIRVYHGAMDKVILPEESENMVEALRVCGGDPELTIYPDLEHDSWTRTYHNPELYEWLLKQSLNNR